MRNFIFFFKKLANFVILYYNYSNNIIGTGEKMMKSSFDKITKNFGMGCMRFPVKENNETDIEQVKRMVDVFIQNGFNYFDTAHAYIDGKSERIMRECLTERYGREEYILTNKLSTNFFEKNEEIRPLFQKQLEECGVEYFDFYLMHAQDKALFEKYKKCRAYETALELKKEGKFIHFGISFHDKADVLEKILTEYPEIEVVQLQFNYFDYEDVSVESRKCYEICRKYDKKVIVMEPVKGGNLANLPDDAKKIIDDMGNGTPASYAIRFAASFEGIIMVLSGMSNYEMTVENIGFMKNFVPLTKEERECLESVCEVLKKKGLVSCTACRYCISQCPKKILIPDLFSCFNGKKIWNNWNSNYYYGVHTQKNGKAGDCIECGKCEKICPQHLNIRELLKIVSNEFEKR